MGERRTEARTVTRTGADGSAGIAEGRRRGSGDPAAGRKPGVFALSRASRRPLLALHVMVSVGWLGLTLTLLTLGIEGRVARDRAAYQAMRVLADALVIPVSLVALVSGLMLGLGTRWGVLRHWWVLAKLGLTLAATAASIFALRPMIHDGAAHGGDGLTGINLIVAPSVGLVVYGTATVLSFYKPWGRTTFRRRPD